jgi:hypothetical protein
MRRRTIWISVGVILVAAAIVAAFLLRRREAPEPARLLPEADAYLYFNLKPLRTFGIIGKNAPVVHELEYEEFVRETGFQFERDLDEAAFAVHSPPRLIDSEPAPGQPESFRRYSEIFRGHFDSSRARNYFRKLAKSVEAYREVEIYSIPMEGRTVRVALLGVGIAAVSNTDGPQAIHYMIDRYKQLALPFGGPTLVRQYYRRVPFASLLWGIAQVSNESGKGTPLILPGGFDLFFPSNTVIVGSVRYTTAVQVKAEAFAASAEEAKQIVDQVNTFLSIFRGLENRMNPGGSDPDVKAFFNSLEVQLYKTRAVLNASVPPAFLRKLFSEPPTQQITGAPPPEEQPKQQPEKRQRKKGK